MEALGALSPIETARAQVQEKIGDFLSSRSRLIRLQRDPRLQIKSQANVLYAIQLQLEDKLYKDIFPLIQKIQSGVWDLSDVVTLGGFTASIVQQIESVNKLDREAGNQPQQALLDNPTVQIGIPVLILGGIALGILFSR